MIFFLILSSVLSIWIIIDCVKEKDYMAASGWMMNVLTLVVLWNFMQ